METALLMELSAYHAGGRGYVARADIPVGGVVARLNAPVGRPAPTKYTIQVGVDEHVDVEEVRYLNHSCVPSTFVDTTANRVVAIRPIVRGEALTFFYPSTEWEMADPFDCQCGSSVCLGRITGAAALPAEVLERYALNAHIRGLLAERERAGSPAASSTGDTAAAVNL